METIQKITCRCVFWTPVFVIGFLLLSAALAPPVLVDEPDVVDASFRLGRRPSRRVNLHCGDCAATLT